MLSAQSLCVDAGERRLLDDVSFSLDTGECLCIIGESGSGKTTLLKSLQGLMPFSQGSVRHTIAGSSVEHLYQPKQSYFGLPDVSWVMQNPAAALNPFQTVGKAILEGLYRSGLPQAEKQTRLIEVMGDVELSPELINRKPTQISLGQAQRVCIARALISCPQILIFDEPLSALDAVVQKQIARVIDDICQSQQLSTLFVTHDLGFARAYADKILLLRAGKVEAYQPVDAFFANPASAYGAELIEAATILGALEPAAPVEAERAALEVGQ